MIVLVLQSVRARNFPLGSSILYRNGNAWTLGCVVSSNNDYLTVSTPEDTDPNKVLNFKPSSVDITPVGRYADGMSITIGKGTAFDLDRVYNA